MMVFSDPAGAFISAWQAAQMGGFETGGANTFGWAELNARGFDKAAPFYEKVFGWTQKKSPMGEGQGEYTEFQLDGQSVAGGLEMPPQVPQQVPSYWLAYFMVENVDEACKKATELGAQQQVPPMDFPGGRFAVLLDPQGAALGLLSMPQQGQQGQGQQQG
jgi:predicted enzyme related to lactoylglutathione lyase